MEAEPEEEAAQPSGSSIMLIAVGCIALLAVVLGFRHFLGAKPENENIKEVNVGLDVDKAPDPGPAELPPVEGQTQVPRPAAESSLSLLKPSEEMASWKNPAPEADTAKQGIAAGTIDLQRKRWNNIWRKYREKYPALREYEKDWMKKPELRELTEAWRRDKNPAAFVRGLMNADSFVPLLKKYIQKPGMKAVAQAQMKAASPATLEAAQTELSSDSSMKKFIVKIGKIAGLPLGALAGGSHSQKEALEAVKKGLPAGMPEADER